jgi:hypothetical protein
MALSTTNLLIYSAQILVLISAAAIGAAIFRLPPRPCPTRLLAGRGGHMPRLAVGVSQGQRAFGARQPAPGLQHRLRNHARNGVGVVAVHSVCSAVAAAGRRRTWRVAGTWSAATPPPPEAQHACLAGSRPRPLEARHGAVDRTPVARGNHTASHLRRPSSSRAAPATTARPADRRAARGAVPRTAACRAVRLAVDGSRTGRANGLLVSSGDVVGTRASTPQS